MAWWEYAIPGWNAYKIAKDINATPEGAKQGLAELRNQAQQSSAFADQAQGNYGKATNQLGATYGKLGDSMDYLGGVMRGQNSVSAEQLRHGMQQGVAAQRSMAASASPQNAAMAARTAAMQMGRLGAGLAGQQAVAGLQERNQAAQQYGQLGSALGQLQLGARGQDVNAAVNSRDAAMRGLGGYLNNPQNQSWLQRNQQLLQTAGGIAMAA